MAVLIRIIGDDDGSDEYCAAKRLKKIIEDMAGSVKWRKGVCT